MIVKFLAKSKTFKGVRYNTNKVEKAKGELMRVSGFGILQGMSQLFPQDYINYLNLVSSRNKRVVYPQLHAIISAKGKECSKEELTEIAEKWLKQMGYADQPYLIIFHKDTRNHHVHIVSTRVNKTSGKKISSAYERLRAMTAINKVMRQDERLVAKVDLEKALSYNFQTRAQFMMILESKGYVLKEQDGKLGLIKFGKVLLEIDPAFLKERKANYQVNQARASQITALLYKYREVYSAQLRQPTTQLLGSSRIEQNGYTSDLIEEFRRMFGIQLLFHGSPGKSPYGYTVLDHDKENVFKGGEIMDMDELLAETLVNNNNQENPVKVVETGKQVQPNFKSMNRFRVHEPDSSFNDSSNLRIMESAYHQLKESSTQQHTDDYSGIHEKAVRIDISDDIDDEAIHGRNRHRKRKARTNAR